jgi:hypothetical protein
MKLRINGYSLRMRLTPDEVSRLCQNGRAEDRTLIGDYHCIYSVTVHDETEISARMTNGQVQVNIPTELVKGWDNDERTGFQHTDQNGLFILIEKDFKCLQTRAHENEDHLYPNPSKDD